MDVKYIYVGIAGSASGDNGAQLRSFLEKRYPTSKIAVESDIMNVIGLAKETSACVAAIIGTGSVAYGWDGKRLRRMGGWGYLFDGAGSGYDIGRELISLTYAADDGLVPECEAVRLVREKLGGAAFSCTDRLYSAGRDYIASFAGIAFEAMDKGDDAARKIIYASARRMASLIAELRRSGNFGHTVIIAGGLVQNHPQLQKMLTELIGDGARVEFPEIPQIFGAMRRCLELSGEMCDFEDLKSSFLCHNNQKGDTLC